MIYQAFLAYMVFLRKNRSLNLQQKKILVQNLTHYWSGSHRKFTNYAQETLYCRILSRFSRINIGSNIFLLLFSMMKTCTSNRWAIVSKIEWIYLIEPYFEASSSLSGYNRIHIEEFSRRKSKNSTYRSLYWILKAY